MFDLLTIRKVPGNKGKGVDGVSGYNVLTIALQVPMTRLTKDGLPPNAGNSVIGIYDVIAYVVSQRTREIGIRSALGAPPGQLEQLFLRQGLALTGVGLAVGVVASVALGRWMSSLLFGVGPFDPMAYTAAVGVTMAAAALASYLPARRAAAIDPIETLRAE